MEDLVLHRKVYNEIVDKAKENSNEICGLGFSTKKDSIIDEVMHAVNISPTDLAEYQFSPTDFWRFLEYHQGKKDDKQLVMIFHSHPSWRAYPSSTDIRKAWKQYIYLIYSCIEDRARAFKKNAGDLMYEIPIRIID